MIRAASFLLVVIVLAETRCVAADPIVVEVWPGKAPEEVGSEGGQASCQWEPPGVAGGALVVKNVTGPRLTSSRPREESMVAAAMLICPGGGYHVPVWQLEGE